MFEHESITDWECRMIKQAILKSAENLHFDPISLADELITAFEKVNEYYKPNFKKVESACFSID